MTVQQVRKSLVPDISYDLCTSEEEPVNLVSFRNFLRLVSFVYFLSLKELSSMVKEGIFNIGETA